jgi:UDP-N-acetylmuramate--alanine ligase
MIDPFPSATRDPLQGIRRIHMIGIGGAGMSALARLYLQQGIAVTGSDQTASRALADLATLGARTYVGSVPARVEGADLVVYSSAVPSTDAELAEALRCGIRTIKHAPALGELFNTRRGIAVAGTHGKTTTTSMIALVLDRCGLSPSFQIGGESVDLGTSARWGTGEWMVIEADEFDRRFLEYRPEIAVVNNVEPDHFEYYHSVEEMEGAFSAFLSRVRSGGVVIAWGEDARLARLLATELPGQVVRYWTTTDGEAFHPGDYVARDIQYTAEGSRFSVLAYLPGGEPETASVTLRVPGEHNVRNALAALATTHTVGVPLADSAGALATFRGALRRFELLANINAIRLYLDYAHHPTEVRVNLEAARRLVPAEGRLWAVFQPHLLTRTERLFNDFTGAFDAADVVVITDVYSPAGREPDGRYRRSGDLVAAITARGHRNARHIPELTAARHVLQHELRHGDIVLVMGAGNVDALGQQAANDLLARAHDPAGSRTLARTDSP